jgi:cyclic pyranopterin phosphate synthase
MSIALEGCVYEFEGLLPDLDAPPIAARRALDHAGLRLSLEAWRSLAAVDRATLALAGAADTVDLDVVASLARHATPPPGKVAPVDDPEGASPPEGLAKALEPNRLLDERRWHSLRALDRYALVHTYRRAVARGTMSVLGETFDAVLGAVPMNPSPRPPPSIRASNLSPVPGAYSEKPREDHAIELTAPTHKPPPAGPASVRALPPSSLSSHLNADGHVRMVDVGDKRETTRRAVAAGSVNMLPETARRLASGATPKGDVLATARVAAILAAKRTPDLIPLCHHVALTKVDVTLVVDVPTARVDVTVLAEAHDRTGVEMEALTAVSVACLTIYDMLKGIDRGMTIGAVRLLEKTGGKSGDFHRDGRDGRRDDS